MMIIPVPRNTHKGGCSWSANYQACLLICLVVFSLPDNSQVPKCSRHFMAFFHAFIMGSENRILFCGIDFSYSIGRNADPLSTNQITSKRPCDLIGRAIFAAIWLDFQLV